MRPAIGQRHHDLNFDLSYIADRVQRLCRSSARFMHVTSILPCSFYPRISRPSRSRGPNDAVWMSRPGNEFDRTCGRMFHHLIPFYCQQGHILSRFDFSQRRSALAARERHGARGAIEASYHLSIYFEHYSVALLRQLAYSIGLSTMRLPMLSL